MQIMQQKNQQQGMITVVISLMLMLVISIVILLVAKSSTIEQRISANQFGVKQAMAAAQAGMQYAVPYLAANKATIVKDTNADGYIDSYSDANTNNVALANGAHYTITYTNPTANNLNLIRITSVGTSANGATTKTVTQLVQNYSSTMPHPGNVGLVAKSLVTLSGNVDVVNTATNLTIESGGIINSSGSVDMTTSSGSTSDPNNPVSGANMNNTSLQNATNAQLFQNFFGTTMAGMQAKANLYYATGGDFSSTLSGVTGKVIYINGSANFASSGTIGSATQPVIIIVNGSVSMSSTTTIYGFVYSTQSMNFSGHSTFRGVAAAAGNFNVSGNVDVIYDSTVITNLAAMGQSYAVVPGSWRDF